MEVCTRYQSPFMPVTSTDAPLDREYILLEEVPAPSRTFTSLALIAPLESISLSVSELPEEELRPDTFT